ncbi:conserved Plasmodium protein, unknown function [Plasmodium sp. gorilla clade G3]|nr:conserved Plasmodium protein, unknown function [Plasmodium sp. gorilla clade G3]
MRNVLFNGPMIPDIDSGYNVQVNGISVNFLKDPFCFRNVEIKNAHYKNKLLYKHFNDDNVNKNITNNIKWKNIVELDKGFNEYIKDSLNNKHVYIKKNEFDYKLNDIKSPIYKERTKYTPKTIEVIRTNYNVPQVERVKINKENLIMYMNNIEYKKANEIIEKVILTIKNETIQKAMQLANDEPTNILEPYNIFK